MIDQVYIPNLKTSDAELRALRYLQPDVKKLILPAFELTRSRVTTKLPRGSVRRRAEQLIEVYGDSDFILDITTENDLLNPEMNSFFDEDNGYANWRSFLDTTFNGKIVPCLQYDEGGSRQEFQRQASSLVSRFGKVALRTSVSDAEAVNLYAWALEVAGERNLIVLGSLYFLDQQSQGLYLDRCSGFIRRVVSNRVPDAIAFPASSFPKSVGGAPYGDDAEGKFAALELPLFDSLRTTYPNLPLVYSDFASVHPIRYPTRGGTWVPRIDVFSGGQFAYSRLRSADGGYVQAARNIIREFGSSLPASWGNDQIRQAARGVLPGRSPSFWISARINMWITQRAMTLASP